MKIKNNLYFIQYKAQNDLFIYINTLRTQNIENKASTLVKIKTKMKPNWLKINKQKIKLKITILGKRRDMISNAYKPDNCGVIKEVTWREKNMEGDK